MIKHEDLDKFKGQYPYGSELFGVYQTLLGWRGARARNWFLKSYAPERLRLRDAIFTKLRPDLEMQLNADQVLDDIGRIGIGLVNDQPKYASRLIESLAQHIPSPAQADDPQFWKDHLTDDMLLAVVDTEILDLPDPLQPDEPAATISTTPVDRVFEFGFDPLLGGFRAQSIEGNEFEIIDQWIEVVPTDQVAAVSVKYNPMTGRQIPPA